MADNVAATPNGGAFPDWIELLNTSARNVDLAGWSITDQSDIPRKFIFPIGASLAPGAYVIVWSDDRTSAPGLHTGFALGKTGGGILLFDQLGQIADRVEYGFQVADRSIGRTSDGTWQLMETSTPGAANAPSAALGTIERLRFNEWMADPAQGNDWFELFNPDPLPVELSGLFLTDDPSAKGRTNFQIAPLSFVAGLGWVRWEADRQTQQGPNHVTFNLSRAGESLRIYTPTLALIDGIDFGPQTTGVSQGRLPDGGAAIVSFPNSPTPSVSNFIPISKVVINEVLTHTDPPLEDAIELFNRGLEPVEVSGWYLSDELHRLKKFRIPDRTIIPAKGFRVFYQAQFGAVPGEPESFTLNSFRGDEVHLSAVGANGELNGYRTTVRFGAVENGVSFGRFLTSSGTEFVAMSERSLGVDNPASLDEFRGGRGGVNPYPKIGPVVINEIMYHPVTDAQGAVVSENTDEEFIELQNISIGEIPLFDLAHPANTWRLRGGVEFTFPRNLTLAPGEYVVLVGFGNDPSVEARFRAKHNIPASVRLLGPYRGKLDNGTETLELLMPDPPQTAGPEAGLVPYILVDRVIYQDRAPWPETADGAGASLQRRNSFEFANDPVNWVGAPPTAGRVNAWPAVADTDSDGMSDDWEHANGLNPNSAIDANQDSDFDGMSNLSEFRAGTHPANAESILQLDAARESLGMVTIRFQSAPGKSYRVQVRESLGDTAGWKTLEDIPATQGGRSVEVTDPATGASRGRFYRVVLR